MTDRPQLSSDTATEPEVEALVERIAGLCEGERPIVRTLGDCDLAALPAELACAPAAVLWGAPGEGSEGVEQAAGSLRRAGMPVSWAGLVRSRCSAVVDLPVVVAGGTWEEAVTSGLACGPASLSFDARAGFAGAPTSPARVAIVSFEVIGPTLNGGIGTATSSLAVALAAAGHEVVLRYCAWQPLSASERDRWRHFYARAGVDFDGFSDNAPGVESPSFNQRRSHEIYRWLSEEHAREPFDVVHFPECQGHGYYSLLAKRQKLDFDGVTMVVGVHSATRWILESNRSGFVNLFQLADDHMERECIALADVVVSPSAYMLGWIERAGWTLPERTFVQQYVLPRNLVTVARDPVPAPLSPAAPIEGPGVDAARDLGIELPGHAEESTAAEPAPGGESGLREIVFFGRLEVRKGIERFCDALDELARDQPVPDVAISFLGKPMLVHGIDAVDYVTRRAARWPWPFKIHDDLNQLEAVEYLRRPGRLAVMASPVDNSPNTIYEALALGIGFRAARTGGIPELLHPADVATATYDHEEPGSLAQTLREVLEQPAERPLRFAVDPEVNVRTIADWHGRIAAARRQPKPVEARPRKAPVAINGTPLVSAVLGAESFDLLHPTLDALERQDLAGLETVLAVPDGPDDAAAAYIDGLEARFEGRRWRVERLPGCDSAAEARSRAASSASGEWLWLTRAGAVGTPGLLSTLVASAREMDADVAFVATSYADAASTGDEWRGFVPLGAGVASLILSEGGPAGVLVRRRALAELGGLPGRSAEAQNRNLALRAALAARRIAVVPEPLASVIDGPRPEPFPDDEFLALAQPLAHRLPPELADLASILPRLSYADLAPTPVVPDDVKIYVGKLEREMREIVESKSWRWTRSLRDAAEWTRSQVRAK